MGRCEEDLWFLDINIVKIDSTIESTANDSNSTERKRIDKRATGRELVSWRQHFEGNGRTNLQPDPAPPERGESFTTGSETAEGSVTRLLYDR